METKLTPIERVELTLTRVNGNLRSGPSVIRGIKGNVIGAYSTKLK